MIQKTLTVDLLDRWYLQLIIPQEGTRIKMVLTKGIIQQLEFQPEEVHRWAIEELPNGGFKYDLKGGPTEKDIFLTPEQVMLIVEAFKKADKEERLPYKMLDLFERIEKI